MPLYPGAEHRAVSLVLMAKAMGAVEPSASALQRADGDSARQRVQEVLAQGRLLRAVRSGMNRVSSMRGLRDLLSGRAAQLKDAADGSAHLTLEMQDLSVRSGPRSRRPSSQASTLPRSTCSRLLLASGSSFALSGQASPDVRSRSHSQPSVAASPSASGRVLVVQISSSAKGSLPNPHQEDHASRLARITDRGTEEQQASPLSR